MPAKKKAPEKELARKIQRRKGDTSTWSKRSVSADEEKLESAVVFSVRFSPHELDGIRKQADALGVTVASIIRRAVVEHSARQTMVFDFMGAGSPPSMVLLGASGVPIATGCKMRNLGFPDYLRNIVIPGVATNGSLPLDDEEPTMAGSAIITQ
jgi:hypothetical protein